MGGGYLLASAASVSYGTATVLQARGVTLLARLGGPASRIRCIHAGSPYVAGLILDGSGFLMSVVALRTLPVFLVQALVCSSIAVTAVLAVPILGAVLDRRQVVALLATCAGSALAAISAREGAAARIPMTARWGLMFAVLPIAALIGIAVRRGRRTRALVFAVASGSAFALVAISARSLDLSRFGWHTMTDPLAWAVLLNGAAGAVAYALALAAGAVTAVATVTFTVETLLPAAVGMLWLGDQVRPGYGLLVWVGLLGTLAGAVFLSRGAVAPERAPEPAVVRPDPGGM